MSTYIDRLATEVMESEHPAVVMRLCEANARDLMLYTNPTTARWARSEASRNFLAAVLKQAAIAERVLTPAEALKVASRIAERSAAVTGGAA